MRAGGVMTQFDFTGRVGGAQRAVRISPLSHSSSFFYFVLNYFNIIIQLWVLPDFSSKKFFIWGLG